LGDIPFAELDWLYRHILASVHNIKVVLLILGALLCCQKLNSKKDTMGKTEVSIPIADPRFLEELLSLNRGDVPFILTDLQAIVNVPDARRNAISQSSNPRSSDQCVRILHTSFADFLMDRSRAGRYFINAVKIHAELARCCLRSVLSGRRPRFSFKWVKLTGIFPRAQIRPPIRWTGSCHALPAVGPYP
jgi:hypothetical protein